MGVDYGSYSSHPMHSAPHATGSNRPSGSSYATAIDLTSETPKKRSRKRKSEANDEGEDGCNPAKKKAKSKDEEKRLKRFRVKAPGAYQDVRHRALTQRMFVIDRERHPAKKDDGSIVEHPTETISLAGTTGNVYTINIDKIPTCDCPHARKGNQCKHVIYVMARVLRVPDHLEYQLAYLSTELKEIFDKAPPLPSKTGEESAKDGNRKELEGMRSLDSILLLTLGLTLSLGECPICCVDFEPENTAEKVVYCKAACGNNIHKTCFDQWARTKPGAVTCPFCRSPWEADESAVQTVAKSETVNAEGYVNVASQLGLSGRRDYSTYNKYWVRNRGYGGWD